jgi:hypothetical protein
VKKVLERYTGEDWSKRNEGEIGTSWLPPKWLAELRKAVTEAIARRESIVHRREVDIAL